MKNRLKGNFTIVANKILNDKDLSLGAKGLYAFLSSKPDTWEFSYKGLTAQLKEKESAIRRYVKELVEKKILIRIPKREENGNFKGWEWILHPNEEDLKKHKDPALKTTSENGTSENGTSENGTSENRRTLSNTKKSNKEINNKEENINNSENATKNTSKGEEKSKQENSKTKENLQNLIFFIKSFLKEKNIILSPKQNFLLENIILSLSKTYSLEEIKEVLEFAKEHSFYSKFLANPKALENNFNSIRLEYLQQKEKEEENTFFFGLGG